MNNPTAEIDNLIRRIDDELLILQDAPRLKKYKFYNFGVALKHLIESCQKHGLDTNPYYGHKIQEYIAVYRDLFGGADLKNNVVSDLQPNGVIIVSSSLPPKVRCVSYWRDARSITPFLFPKSVRSRILSYQNTMLINIPMKRNTIKPVQEPTAI